jgi:hypothetical protein
MKELASYLPNEFLKSAAFPAPVRLQYPCHAIGSEGARCRTSRRCFGMWVA